MRPVAQPDTSAAIPATALGKLGARLLRAQLAKIEHGRITWIDGADTLTFGELTERCALSCTVRVHDARCYAEIAFGGSVGSGESFVAGDWTCDDLTALARIFVVNRDVLDGMEGGLARLTNPARRVLHALSRNTRQGSRRNIAAHYDLGNDFFELFLDPTMMYSCAVYERPGMTLQQAQEAKLDRLCRKLELKPSDHLLEIGTGWGGLALHAARNYGCRVTTTTISRRQHERARERIDAAGLGDRITLRLDDYRDLTGQYEKIVSVEMIEAIGHHYFDTFFACCNRLLVPGGTMALQTITIDDRYYASARDSVDFIKKHIFPGCCIPAVSPLVASISRAPSLRVVDLEDIGLHYAPTLAAWRENMFVAAAAIRERGYPDTLLRMWHFYLSYCEAGFAERTLGNVQMVLQDTRAPAAPPRRS
jgi:cyclopropane-fatty-acyl-phospholipid synthase